MGVLRPFCIATDGTYAYAISFAFDNSRDGDHPEPLISPQYAILAQSNAFPDFSTFENLTQQDIEEALTWKSTHIIPDDVADSWFRWKPQASTTKEYGCGAVNFGGPASKDNFTFVLHVTDPPNIVEYMDFPERRLTTVKFGPNGKHEVFQDLRRVPSPEGPSIPGLTMAGSAKIRSPLIPLDSSDVNTPWVEAFTAYELGFHMTTSVNGSFPAIVQERRGLPYPLAGLGFGPQKLHIMGAKDDCVRLATSNTRVENKTMILADDPAGLPYSALCGPPTSAGSTVWKVAEVDGVVYALGAKNNTQTSFDLIQFHPNTTTTTKGDINLSTVNILGNQPHRDPAKFQELLPLLPFKSGSSLTGFMAANLNSTFILFPTAKGNMGQWKATPFNITISDPYKYFDYRDPEPSHHGSGSSQNLGSLSKLQIGLIAGGSCLALIIIVASVWKYMQLKKRSREATERDTEGAGARTGAEGDAE